MKYKKWLIWGMSAIFLLAVSPRPAAALSPTIDGVGFRLSLVIPEDNLNTGFGLGAHMDMKLINWLHFYPSLEYAHAGSDNYYYPNWANYYHFSLNDFCLNADFRAYPQFSSHLPFNLFGGMGLVLAITSVHWDWQGNAPPYWQQSSSDVGIGLDILFGADIPIGSLMSTIELKFKIGGNWDMFKLTGGLTFPLGKR
jgi:hypothetical protein